MKLGSKLKELRMKKGLSLEELAERLNEEFNTSYNKGMISKWENGVGDPRLEAVRHLAIFFNASLDYLLDLDEKEEVNTIAAHHDGDEWTDEELDEIERFKAFVRSKRDNKGL
jgi:transcriptional regulator with XRE-family HTH domain